LLCHLFGPLFRSLGLLGITIHKSVISNLPCCIVDQALAAGIAGEGREQD
jgi:hypothetical protein